MSGANDWTPMLPLDLVEATEHHGPYITSAYGADVCDFYTMSNPQSLSVRNGGDSKPVPFTDANEYAAFMVRAANAHDELLAGLRQIVDLAGSPSYMVPPVVRRIAAAILAKHGGASISTDVELRRALSAVTIDMTPDQRAECERNTREMHADARRILDARSAGGAS